MGEVSRADTDVREYRVHFSHLDTYGNRRRITTVVPTTNEDEAVIAARARIADLYGITGARFEGADDLAAEWTGTDEPRHIARMGFRHG